MFTPRMPVAAGSTAPYEVEIAAVDKDDTVEEVEMLDFWLDDTVIE